MINVNVSLSRLMLIGLLVILAISGVIYWIHKPTVNPAQQLLQKEQLDRSIERDSLNRIINHNNDARKIDSVLITDLQEQIEADGVKITKRRIDAAKLTPSEKVNFLLDRYSSKHE